MRKGRGHSEASVQIRLHHFSLDAAIPDQDGLFLEFHFTVVQHRSATRDGHSRDRQMPCERAGLP
jgi:hypothetical protein